MNSNRLPGKVMLNISGKPIVQHIFDRLNYCKKLQSIVISTGPYQQNSVLCDYAKKKCIPIFTGKETDLIDRIYNTALKYDATAIVRITADCPLVDPEIVDKLITIFEKDPTNFDLVTNCLKNTFPHGLDVEVYSFNVIERLWNQINDPEYREWFSLHIRNNSKDFKIYNFENSVNLSNIRLTVDYKEDLELINKMFKNSNSELLHLDEIIKLFEKFPEMKKINEVYHNHRNIDAPN